MAKEDDTSWWGNWTSGILENVREKTSTALEFVQNDLSEFINTVQHDTTVVIADSATAVNSNLKVDDGEKDKPTGKLKQGISDLLQSISTTLHNAAENTTAEKSPGYQDNVASDHEPRVTTVYDRQQARLHEVQTDPETYRNDPVSNQFQTWCETFDLDEKKGEISELLVNNADVRRLYTKFVPIIQSHSTFWHRYFYKVYEIESDNKRLADIVARASQKNNDEDVGWDDDDDDFNVTSTADESELNEDTNVISTTDDDNPEDRSCVAQPDSTHDKSATDSNINEGDKTTLPSKTTVPEGISLTVNNVKNNDAENLKITEKTLSGLAVVDKHSVVEPSNDVHRVTEESKSDSSDSNSWIRVSDKEGSSTNSSSSVAVVNENEKGKEQELVWDDDDDNDDDDDDDNIDDVDNDGNDDDLDLNEDISDEDVAKLVQSITANEIDSDEDEWENWE